MAFVETHVKHKPPLSFGFCNSDSWSLSCLPRKMKVDTAASIFFAMAVGKVRTCAAYHSLLRAKVCTTVTQSCRVERSLFSQEKRLFWIPRNILSHVHFRVSENMGQTQMRSTSRVVTDFDQCTSWGQSSFPLQLPKPITFVFLSLDRRAPD